MSVGPVDCWREGGGRWVSELLTNGTVYVKLDILFFWPFLKVTLNALVIKKPGLFQAWISLEPVIHWAEDMSSSLMEYSSTVSNTIA